MKKFFLVAFAMGICSVLHAQNIPFDAAVRKGRLANGFTYYIRNNTEPKNRVIFYLANKVGAVLETDDQRGLAHFMEHMSFNGTTHFPKNELIDYLQKAGVRFGADINAYTSFDETVYQLPLPADNPEILRNGIEIMHDWAQGATLDASEIDKERGVVLEEMRLGNGASDRMRNKYFPVILNNSRYAERLPIGTEDVLNNFKPESIRRFYRDWYRPDLQALIIVGDVDVNRTEKVIRKKFADLKNPARERPRPKYTVPLTGKNHFLAVTDPEMTLTTAEVIIKQPELPLHTVAQYRQSIIRQLFNMMMDERFNELQRQSDPPFLNAGAGLNSFLGGLDSYSLTVNAKPGELEKAIKAAWRENLRAKRFGFNSSELERAKITYFNQFESALKEKGKTPSQSYVEEYLANFLHGTGSPGIAYEHNMVKKHLAGITLKELNSLAKNAVKTKGRDILLLAPEKDKASLPTETTVIGWMTEVEAENMLAFNDDTSKENLLKTEPPPGTIVNETTDVKAGITTLNLSNGIKVLLKPTDFKNNEILFRGFAPGGTSIYNDADYPSAAYSDIMPLFGAGNYNTTQLDKYLSAKQLSVKISVDERTQNIHGGAVNHDIGPALQLMYAYITQPRKDSMMFQGMMSRSKAALVNRANDPNSVFQDTVSAVLGNHSIRRTGPSIEKLNQINLNRAFDIYRERFASQRGFNFVFVGSFKVDKIKPLIERYIASLPATGKIDEARDLHITIPTGVIEKKVYKGTEPKATVRLVFSGAFDYSLANKQKLDALREILEIRLLERLREDEGGVYSPSVGVTIAKYPQQRYNFNIGFDCAPQNVDKLIASASDEIDKLKASGPSLVNLNKFKAEEQRTIETDLKTNGFWVNYLTDQLENHDNINEINDYLRQLNAITPADIKETAVRYINGQNFIKLILLPEKNSN